MEKKKTIVDKIWDFFASIKLAIIIFALVAGTSIVGTIVEQQTIMPEKNLKILTKFFGAEAAPTVYKVLDAMGFMDMYHSWWFLAFLFIFAVNLLVCSIDRLPHIMKLVKEPVKPLKPEHFKLAIMKEFVLRGKAEKNKSVVADAIKNMAGFHLSEAQEEEGGAQLYSQKGNYSRLGVYITHISILIILLGAVLGVFFGFKGGIDLPEGGYVDAAYNAKGEALPLGFQIRCDEFEVDFYGQSDMPKEYKSWLTVSENGKDVLSQEISVNTPLKYKGFTFYQASYGLVPKSLGNSVVRLVVTPKGGAPEEVRLKMGGAFPLPGTNMTARVEDFSPAFTIDRKTGQPMTYANMMNNPAVFIGFYENGSDVRKTGRWILKRYPQTWALDDGLNIQLLDVWGTQYTGLQVRKDPGVWVVYLGCILMGLGLYMAFFMSHRKIWVRVLDDKTNTRVIIGASANKNRPALEAKIDKVVSFLTSSGEGGR
ncbi:MAG: cytochrome c biogenesis protein ResB [Nitrospirales bacterium]|nr:cytochrome c biogenesis protein ResB [Nitrospirales bacterium]